MTMHVKDGGIWTTANPKVKDAGVWKQVKTGSVKDAGVWKPFFNNTAYTSLNVSTTGIAEAGGAVSFTLSETGIPDYSYLYYSVDPDYNTGPYPSTSEYTISGTYDNTAPAGSIQIVSNTFANGTFTLTAINDNVSDGNKYFVVTLRTGSVGGPVVLTSPVISISDAGATDCIWALYGRPEWC